MCMGRDGKAFYRLEKGFSGLLMIGMGWDVWIHAVLFLLS